MSVNIASMRSKVAATMTVIFTMLLSPRWFVLSVKKQLATNTDRSKQSIAILKSSNDNGLPKLNEIAAMAAESNTFER
jgi:hypothetical protein